MKNNIENKVDVKPEDFCPFVKGNNVITYYCDYKKKCDHQIPFSRYENGRTVIVNRCGKYL